MPTPIRPDHYLDWTDGASQKQIEPTGGKKLLGWTASERPAFQFMNWLFWWTDTWIKYLDQYTQITSTAAGISASAVGHHVATGTNVQAQLDQLDAALSGLNLVQKPLSKISSAVYQLPTVPSNPASIIVVVNGAIDLETEWSYDQANNRIDFVSGSEPAAGQSVEAIYLTGGTGGAGMGGFVPYGNPGSPIVVNPSVGIASHSDAFQVIFVVSQGGQQNVTANPRIAAGTQIGQVLRLVGTSDTNYSTLADGNGLSLNGPVDLKNHKVIDLMWDSSVWVETSRR